MVRRVFVFIFLLSFGLSAAAQAPGDRDGEVRLIGDTQQAWNAETGSWVSLDAFWEQYAERHGGLKWGRTDVWPPYEELAERDLMIIELAQGPCMMEFWHSRWRRANDVRRWDEAFNGYAGCPHVFD